MFERRIKMSRFRDDINDVYNGGYRFPYHTKKMVVDEEATKDAIYIELEDMANEMAKIMDSAGIDIFEYSVFSPQRKRSWKISAQSKETSGRYKWEESDKGV